MEPVPRGARAICARCGLPLHRRKPNSRQRTLALALAALILYLPANLFPIVKTTYMGTQQKTTIFDGIQGLFQKGSYFVGALVFTTSILTPAIKIFGLLFLALTVGWPRWQQFRTRLYRTIQIIDPWNILEVTLLAILVAVAELGKIATVHPGPGVFSFAGVVLLTICATITFDPRLIWDTGREKDELSA
ncbi:MAG TPA: paraquat-inducible protein A [Candidatus Sulfotelmatobacter sp.]|nr:paraquat-inducible protein A [Candidatus Sulfotelmatobacter sp.]